jgi:hypothetical protein
LPWYRVVVIDGALTDAWHLIEPVIRKQLNIESQPEINVLLRPSAFGGDAALIGAATLPFSTVFATGRSQQLARVTA